MYFTKIKIENYGCIKDVEHNFHFDANNNPIPLVLIGKNGSGKTLLLACLVDSLIEFKRSVYHENIYETEKNKYYRLGSRSYIKTNNNTSKVSVIAKVEGKNLTYCEIASRLPQEALDKGEVMQHELKSMEQFLENGFSRKQSGSLKKLDFANCSLAYFPIERRYTPKWLQNPVIQSQNIQTDAVDKPKSNLIKDNLLEINDWLMNVYLEKVYSPVTFPDNVDISEDLRGRTVQLLVPTYLQQVISSIVNIIKGNSTNYKQNTSRKNKQIGYVGENFNIEDVAQFSEGEINLFSYALTMVKDWDLTHNDVKLNDIKGICIIDEADLGLHMDFAYRAFPKLIKLFPKVQFIFTTHSPFLLAGLKKEFENNIDIIDMPSGVPINNIESFSELQEAFSLFDNQALEMAQRIESLEKETKRLQTLTDKIFIATEGKTDMLHIKNAFDILYPDSDIKDKIEYFDFSKKDTLGDELKKFAKAWSTSPNANVIIAIYDRDKYIVNNNPTLHFNCLGNNVYEMNIPALENEERQFEDKICIEHYYTNSEIKTNTEKGRLYMGNDFDKFGTSNDGYWSYKNFANNNSISELSIIDSSCPLEQKDDSSKIISKTDFANYIIGHKDKFNFDNFSKIFDVIKEIYDSAKSTN